MTQTPEAVSPELLQPALNLSDKQIRDVMDMTKRVLNAHPEDDETALAAMRSVLNRRPSYEVVDLMGIQESAGHKFTVNDEGVAFCTECGEFMTFPVKPCSNTRPSPKSKLDGDALAIVDSMLEDLHNAITIEPVGLILSMGQCINRYDELQKVKAALTASMQVGDVEGLLNDFVRENDHEDYPFKGEDYDLALLKYAFEWILPRLSRPSSAEWQPISTAPKDGTEIETDQGFVFWSERPVCMLGERNGGFVANWATGKSSGTDYNLPVDPPTKWKPAPQDLKED